MMSRHTSSSASRCSEFQDGSEGRSTGMQTQGGRCSKWYWYFAVRLHRSWRWSFDRSGHLHGGESSSIAAQDVSGKIFILSVICNHINQKFMKISMQERKVKAYKLWIYFIFVLNWFSIKIDIFLITLRNFYAIKSIFTCHKYKIICMRKMFIHDSRSMSYVLSYLQKRKLSLLKLLRFSAGILFFQSTLSTKLRKLSYYFNVDVNLVAAELKLFSGWRVLKKMLIFLRAL